MDEKDWTELAAAITEDETLLVRAIEKLHEVEK